MPGSLRAMVSELDFSSNGSPFPDRLGISVLGLHGSMQGGCWNLQRVPKSRLLAGGVSCRQVFDEGPRSLLGGTQAASPCACKPSGWSMVGLSHRCRCFSIQWTFCTGKAALRSTFPIVFLPFLFISDFAATILDAPLISRAFYRTVSLLCHFSEFHDACGRGYCPLYWPK